MKLQQTSFLNNFPIREWYIDCYYTHTYTSTKSPYRGSILSESVHNHTLPQKMSRKTITAIHTQRQKTTSVPSIQNSNTSGGFSPDRINQCSTLFCSIGDKTIFRKKEKKKIKQSDKMLTPWSNLFLGAIKIESFCVVSSKATTHSPRLIFGKGRLDFPATATATKGRGVQH